MNELEDAMSTTVLTAAGTPRLPWRRVLVPEQAKALAGVLCEGGVNSSLCLFFVGECAWSAPSCRPAVQALSATLEQAGGGRRGQWEAMRRADNDAEWAALAAAVFAAVDWVDPVEVDEWEEWTSVRHAFSLIRDGEVALDLDAWDELCARHPEWREYCDSADWLDDDADARTDYAEYVANLKVVCKVTGTEAVPQTFAAWFAHYQDDYRAG